MVMPALEHLVAHLRDRRSHVVDAVAGHVDDLAEAAIARRVEQRLGELQRAVDRGARRAPIGRARDLAGDRIGRFRAVDQPPRHQDRLVVQAGPLEIGDRDLAMRAGAQRLQEFARGERRPHSPRAAAPALPGPWSSRRRRRCTSSTSTGMASGRLSAKRGAGGGHSRRSRRRARSAPTAARTPIEIRHVRARIAVLPALAHGDACARARARRRNADVIRPPPATNKARRTCRADRPDTAAWSSARRSRARSARWA